MNYYGPEKIRAAIETQELISALRQHLAAPHQNSPRLVLNAGEKAIGSMLAITPTLIGGKVVCVFPANAASGLNPHQGLVALFSPTDGKPTDLFDASEITGLRTAALSALATEVLSAPEIDTLLIFGTGLQAYLHAKMISRLRPIQKIHIHGRDPQKAEDLAARLAAELNIDCRSQIYELPKKPAIYCLCTAATAPYLREEEIYPGSHVNAVGACRPGMREIQLRSSTQMKIYVDDLARVREEASELAGQGKLHLFNPSLLEKNSATPSESTLFKSVGTGLLDIVTADLVRRKLQ